MRYSLKSLAKKPKGSVVHLPMIDVSLGSEKAYLKALREMLRQIFSAYREQVMPRVEAELKRTRDAALIQDVDASWFQILADIGIAFARIASERAQQYANDEGKRHTKSFIASVKKAIGIDLAAVVREEDLTDYLNNAALRNATLIRGLADDVVKRIKDEVIQAVIDGRTSAYLRGRITKTFEISDRRAKLIARDQMAKLNADLNRKRHEEAGITDYIWRTAHDERVRPRHRDLEGKQYKYGEETGAEEGLPPGKPINCRCIAQAIVEF